MGLVSRRPAAAGIRSLWKLKLLNMLQASDEGRPLVISDIVDECERAFNLCETVIQGIPHLDDLTACIPWDLTANNDRNMHNLR